MTTASSSLYSSGAGSAAEGGTPVKAESAARKRQRPKFPSDRKRAAALHLFEEGAGARAVATKLGISFNTVKEWKRLFDRGGFHVRLSKNQYRWSEAEKAKAAALKASGLSWQQVSAKTGISVSTIRKWVTVTGESRKGAAAADEGRPAAAEEGGIIESEEASAS